MSTGLGLLENKTDEKKLVKLARKRVTLPANWLEMEYRHESDVLLIRVSRNKVANSKGDMRNGIVYNYDRQGNLATIEVTQLFGVFANA